MPTFPLTIAQPRSRRFDEIAHEAWRQQAPALDEWNVTTEGLQPSHSRGHAKRDGKEYARRCRSVTEALGGGQMTASELLGAVASDVFPLGLKQLSRHLGYMRSDKMAVRVLLLPNRSRHWHEGWAWRLP